MLCCGSCYMMEESEPIPKTKISLKDGNKPLRTTQTQCWFWLLVLKGHLSWWICHILRADMWCSCRTTKTCSESKAIFLLSTLVTFPASSLKEENDWPFHANQMQLPYTSSQKISLPDIRTHLWQAFVGLHLDTNALPSQHKSTGWALPLQHWLKVQVSSAQLTGPEPVLLQWEAQAPFPPRVSQAWPSQSRREEGPLPQKQFQINTFA